MALIKCNECLSQVSTNAATCPQCGNKIQKKTSLFIWLFIIVVGYIVWGKVFSLSTSSYRNYPSNANQKTSQVDPLQELKNAQPSTLEPYGELAEMFNYGSDYTDLQREIKLKEIRGKVIAWRLPVYEINRYENDYKIQTSSHFKSENIFLQGKEIVNTFVFVTPRNDEDRRLIENLKTGDVVAIKGIVGDDTTMRSLNIKPAILDGYEVSAPVALQAANSPEKTEVVKEVAQIDASISTTKATLNAEAEHVVSEAEAMQLAKENQCLACHAIDRKVVGPAWKDVADKYRGDTGAEAMLSDKIAKGGGGVWGAMQMPRSLNLSEADRMILVRFVLSLK